MFGRIFNPLVLFPGEKVAFWRKYIAFRNLDIWITLSWCLLRCVDIFLIYGSDNLSSNFWSPVDNSMEVPCFEKNRLGGIYISGFLNPVAWTLTLTVSWKNSMQFRNIFLNSFNHLSCLVSDKVILSV